MIICHQAIRKLLSIQQALQNELLDSEKQEIIDLDLNQPYDDL